MDIEEQKKQAQIQNQIMQLESAVKQIMTREAAERYNTLKIAHPEKAIKFLTIAVQLVQTNKLQQINDNVMKEVLQQMEQKRETKIRFR